MQQAYTHFNSGKYKQALNYLSTTNQNYESFQPNNAICQYLSNRCTQASLNCLRKLNDILGKKFKPEDGEQQASLNQYSNVELRSENVIKYNIAVLLILLGKRDNALVVMKQVYREKQCFIEYAQCRILFLFMELQISLKNAVQALTIFQKFPNKPVLNKNTQNQWISVAIHEHNKSFVISTQQFNFLSEVFITQCLIQLGFPETCFSPNEQRQKRRDALIERVKKRKNNINKYYEFNILMMDKFIQAQRYFHAGEYAKALAALNVHQIHDQLDSVQVNKATLNIFGSLANSNVGLINLLLGKQSISLYYFKKAKEVLAKISASPEDRQLLLLTTNYSNQLEKITENMAINFLQTEKNVQQAFHHYQILIRNNHNSGNYKFWYRAGQSSLQFYHLTESIKKDTKNKEYLNKALSYFSNSIACLNQTKIPGLNLTRYYRGLVQEDLQTVILRIKGQVSNFKTSIMLMISYVSLQLKQYYRVILICKQLLDIEKRQKQNIETRFYARSYLIQALISTGRIQDASDILVIAEKQLIETSERTANKASNDQKEVGCFFSQSVPVQYTSRLDAKRQKQLCTQQRIMLYQMCILHIRAGRLDEAFHYQQALIQNEQQKSQLQLNQQLYASSIEAQTYGSQHILAIKISRSLKLLVLYLNLRMGYDRKTIQPYIRGLDLSMI